MPTLAEISDKMPSASCILFVVVMATVACVRLALVGRAVAWSLFAVTGSLGGLLAYIAANDAFVSGPLRDAVWDELGWRWVIVNIAGPFLPAAGVAVILLVRRLPAGGCGFPLDGDPVARCPNEVRNGN